MLLEQGMKSWEQCVPKQLEDFQPPKTHCFFSAGLKLICVDSLVKVWGQVWARQLEQQQSIETWCQGFLASPHTFSVDDRVVKTSPECIAPGNAPSVSHSSGEQKAKK